MIKKQKFGITVVRILRIIIIISTTIVLAMLIAESYNIYPGGYWFKKTIFWLVIFSCMSAFGLCKRGLFGVFERSIYKFIFYLPLVFALFLLIPFIGIGYGLIFYVKFIGDEKFVLYSDNRIRIEQPRIRFLGPDPQPVVYIKQGLISYEDTILPVGYDYTSDSIEVTKTGNSTYSIIVKSPDNYKVASGTERFEYTLR